MTLNLNGASGGFDVRWFDPRNGGGLQSGSVTSVTGGGSRSLGNPPSATTSDWVALVFKPGQLSANAGSDQTVVIAPGATEATVSLTGSVSAGGEPYVAAWSQLSGPGTTGFANSNAPVTTATLTGDPGAYVLQLAATSGTNTAADTVVVTVSTNMPPAVSNLLVNPGIEGTLSPWTAYNDGSCDVQWTTSTSHSGSGAARVYNRVNRWNGVQQDIKSILLANGPGHYAYSAWARTETGVLNAYVTLRMKESGGNNRYFAAPALSIHSTAWQQSAITNFLAWTNLAEAFLYFETSSVETDSFLVDDFVLLPVPPPDTVAPVVGITAPANGSSFIEGAAVTVEAVVSDDGGMAEARLLVNGLWTQTDGAAPYAFEVNGLAAGAHLITVVGVDLAGNQGSNSVTVNIIPPDITPPAVSFLSPTNGQSYYEGQSVPVVIQATDNVVVQEVYLSVDTPVNEVATLPAPPFEHTLTGLPAGPRVLIARAIDTSYNTAFATNSVIVLPRPVLNLDRTQDGLELNWAPTNWLLERSLHLNPSTWDVVVDASSPHWVTTTSSSSFYRLRLP
jgi:hypothetical protein